MICFTVMVIIELKGNVLSGSRSWDIVGCMEADFSDFSDPVAAVPRSDVRRHDESAKWFRFTPEMLFHFLWLGCDVGGVYLRHDKRCERHDVVGVTPAVGGTAGKAHKEQPENELTLNPEDLAL